MIYAYKTQDIASCKTLVLCMIKAYMYFSHIKKKISAYFILDLIALKPYYGFSSYFVLW